MTKPISQKILQTCNLPRKKILTEKCHLKVLKMFEPARPAVENVLYEKEQEIFSHEKSV